MLKILVADDTQDKIKNIKKLLLTLEGISSENIDIAPDLTQTRLALEKQTYDLLILDLVMPEEFGDDPSPDNSIELIKELSLHPCANLPYHIIGITAFSDLQEQYIAEFQDHLWFLIEYAFDSDNWKELLVNKIQYLIRSKKTIQNSNQDYEYDVAIVTALHKPELEKVLQLNGKWKQYVLNNDSTQYFKGEFSLGSKKIKVIAASATQMGMTATTTLSMKMIYNFRPRYLIMCGIAAGIKGKGEFGDILIADQVWDGASGKIRPPKKNREQFLPDSISKTLDEDIKESFLNLKSSRLYLSSIKEKWPADKPSSSLNISIGPMASLPAVIQDKEYVEILKSHSRKMIGIEMEAYGIFYSSAHCSKPKPKPISMKSICDFADEKKNDNFQDYAAYTSATFMYHFILNHLDFE